MLYLQNRKCTILFAYRFIQGIQGYREHKKGVIILARVILVTYYLCILVFNVVQARIMVRQRRLAWFLDRHSLPVKCYEGLYQGVLRHLISLLSGLVSLRPISSCFSRKKSFALAKTQRQFQYALLLVRQYLTICIFRVFNFFSLSLKYMSPKIIVRGITLLSFGKLNKKIRWKKKSFK